MGAFVVGGDLPKAHLGGREIGKVTGWRPLRDVVAGSRVGALLEQTSSEISLTVYQDGALRSSTKASLPQGWGQAAVHGVVDVCGHVRRVEIKQGMAPPVQVTDAPVKQGPPSSDGE